MVVAVRLSLITEVGIPVYYSESSSFDYRTQYVSLKIRSRGGPRFRGSKHFVTPVNGI